MLQWVAPAYRQAGQHPRLDRRATGCLFPLRQDQRWAGRPAPTPHAASSRPSPTTTTVPPSSSASSSTLAGMTSYSPGSTCHVPGQPDQVSVNRPLGEVARIYRSGRLDGSSSALAHAWLESEVAPSIAGDLATTRRIWKCEQPNAVNNVLGRRRPRPAPERWLFGGPDTATRVH